MLVWLLKKQRRRPKAYSTHIASHCLAALPEGLATGSGSILIAMKRFALGIALVAILNGQTTRPDPREIPVPPIRTSMPAMPGWADRPHGMVQGDWDALPAFADKFLMGKTVTRRFDEFPAE